MRQRRRRILAALTAVWLAVALVWRPAAGDAAVDLAAGLQAAEGRQVEGLTLRDPRAPEVVLDAARLPPRPGDLAWTTNLGAAFAGTLVSDAFALATDLRVPWAGSLAGGNALRLWIFAPDGAVWHQLACDGKEERALAAWTLDTRRWAGGTARLALEDVRADPEGWIAIGAPVVFARPDPRMATYFGFAITTAIVGALVLAPGLACVAAFPRAGLLRLLLPLPGLLALAAFGALLWLLQAGGDATAGRAYVLLNLGLASFAAWRGPQDPGDAAGDDWPLAIWGLTFATAALIGVNPLPVESEYHAHTSLPGRMVASPGDHAIPYQTAVYFHHGHDGRVHSAAYFGDWGLCARGPLVPLAVNGLFAVFGARPADPPEFDRSRWPLAGDGAHLARILGWLANAMVVLGAARLLRAMAVGPAATTVTLAWVALAPVTSINVVFLWPKLLAACFVLLAAADLIEARRARAGVFAALAWLSHPVGALYAVPLGLLTAHLGWLAAPAQASVARCASAGLRAAFAFASATLVVVAPWLALKVWLAQPDPFASYVLGDGRTFTAAASVASWLQTRWSNLWYTVVPGAFLWEGQMRVWLDGALSEPMRWTVQYAKTLPAHLGFSFFLVGYLALAQRRAPCVQLLKLHLVAGALALMLVFWGFSSDGLGRNSLEPLSVLVIVLAGPWWGPKVPRWAIAALVALWGEGVWIGLSGMLASRAFSAASTSGAGWSLAFASVIPSLLAVWSAARRLR